MHPSAETPLPLGPEPVHTLVVDPDNIDFLLAGPPRTCEVLRIDVTTTCNIRCGYCEIERGTLSIDVARARRFYEKCIHGVRHVVFGCEMEPTVHRELGRHLLAARETMNPPGDLAIQSNGLLLDRLDPGLLREARLNLIALSIDSVDPAVMARLRDGTDLAKVLRNVRRLRQEIPGLALLFSSVVTSTSLDGVDRLLAFAVDEGVREVWLRQVTFQYEEPTPERRALALDDSQVRGLEERLAPWREQLPVHFLKQDDVVATDEANRAANGTTGW